MGRKKNFDELRMQISMVPEITLCSLLILYTGSVCAYLSAQKFAGTAKLHLSSAKSVPSLRLPSFFAGRRTNPDALRMAVAQGGMDQIVSLKMPTAVKKSWEVHKFGGASLADAGLYRTVGDLLIAESKGRGDGAVPTMAIVSAMSGTTDQLIGVVNAALKDPAEAKKLLDVAVDKQINTLKDLAGPEIVGPIERNIRKDADDIMGVLQALKLLRTIPAVTLELITGFGEVICNDCTWMHPSNTVDGAYRFRLFFSDICPSLLRRPIPRGRSEANGMYTHDANPRPPALCSRGHSPLRPLRPNVSTADIRDDIHRRPSPRPSP